MDGCGTRWEDSESERTAPTTDRLTTRATITAITMIAVRTIRHTHRRRMLPPSEDDFTLFIIIIISLFHCLLQ